MRSKKKTAVGGGGAASQTTQNILPLQFQFCFEGETLTGFVKSVHREIKSARAMDETLPLKFWFKAILLASDCNPRSLTKHIPALAASRNVPLISVKYGKEGSLRLGELTKVKTTIAIGVKVKGCAINRVIEEALADNKINSIEDETMEA